MLDKEQFLEWVVQPALSVLAPDIPYDPDAPEGAATEQLLMGTAMQESGLRYLKQLGGGPACGVFQMEPNTHDDIWENFLVYRGDLERKIQQTWGRVCNADDLVTDLGYAAAMCRVHYYRAPDRLPLRDDIAAQAGYWKRWYNTEAGKGTAYEYIQHWNEADMIDLWVDR